MFRSLFVIAACVTVTFPVYAQMSPYKDMPTEPPKQSLPVDDDGLSPIQRDRQMGNIGSHGIGHQENHDWYRQLKSPRTGYSCCNGEADGVEGDCRPTRTRRDENDKLQVLVDGEWREAIFDIILKNPAPDNKSHVCASKHGTIYCVIEGTSKQ